MRNTLSSTPSDPNATRDALYVGRLVNYLQDFTTARFGDAWSKAGVIVNHHRTGSGMHVYSLIEWKGERYERWIAADHLHTMWTILYEWQAESIQADLKPWTAMFVGATSAGQASVRLEFDDDYGAWALSADDDNRLKLDAALAQL